MTRFHLNNYRSIATKASGLNGLAFASLGIATHLELFHLQFRKIDNKAKK